MRHPLIIVPLVLSLLYGCSSQSPMASSATTSMGDWSPVGSRQVTRQKQYVLASQYRLYVARLPLGLSTEDAIDLNGLFSETLARYLGRYFLQVERADEASSVSAALAVAAAAGAEILFIPRVESWPDIDPLRVQQCENATGEKEMSLHRCESTDDEKQGVMALSIAIYDVRAGVPVDNIAARSQRGVASYISERSRTELELLCEMITGQLSTHATR